MEEPILIAHNKTDFPCPSISFIVARLNSAISASSFWDSMTGGGFSYLRLG